MTNQEKYNERLKRVNDAIEMKIPDQIPCIPYVQTFPYLRQGHTMAQVLYDQDLANEDNMKYHLDFEPDLAINCADVMAGEGKLLEMLDVQFLRWAGMPGVNIDKNSIHQFIEKDYLQEDEYGKLLSDISGWVFNEWLPRTYGSMKDFAFLDIAGMLRGKPAPGLRQFGLHPGIVEAFKTIGKAAEGYEEINGKNAAQNEALKAAGFPIMMGGGAQVAFDALSDSLRGTLGIMEDVITQPDLVHEAMEVFHKRTVRMIRAQLAGPSQGKFIAMMLHKGFDGFLGIRQYEEFYYPYLKAIVEEILRCGGTPYVYTEGKYDSRLEILMDLPKGTVVHIEEADMKRVKETVGKEHCITGGFKLNIIRNKTVPEIKDEVKRFLDVAAMDGGYMFDIDYTLDDLKDENVHAVFDAVREYGSR